MEVSGSYTLYAPRERVWAYLFDPSVLQRIIPGCEMLELDAPDHFHGRVHVRIAAVQGDYEGTLRLLERVEPEHVHLAGEASGTRGVMRGDGVLTLEARAPSTTIVTYVAEAQPGGMLASVGMRVLGGVSRMLINQFFARLADELDATKPSDEIALAPHETATSSASVGATSAPDLLSGMPPEARPLDGDDTAPEARPLETVGVLTTSIAAATAPAHDAASSAQVASIAALARPAATAREYARSAVRRAGLTDGSIASERQLAWRAMIVMGVVLSALTAAIAVFFRRGRAR